MKANHHPKGSPQAPVALLRPISRRTAAAAAGALLLGLGAAGCSSSDDEDDGAPFLILSTGQAIATGTSPLAADDDWLAYLVSEAAQGGQDLNGDGDTSDGVAVRFDTDDGTAEVLGVAATDLAFARRTLFLTVLESQDDTDWNTDGDRNDRVLLFNTPASGQVTYLDDLTTDTEVIAIGSAVFYATPTAPTMELESNLRLVEVGVTGSAPGTPTMIMTGTDPNMDGISFTVNGRDQDIVFLSADETVDGDLNGDGDSTDEAIFAVMDAGAVTPTAVVTGVGVDLSSGPGVAMTPGGEWLVAFLAEEAQEGVSLNDPGNLPVGWAAANCSSADADTTDNVLHWFLFSDLAMNTPPENTGLVGDSTGKAYALGNGYVGVVSNEGDQGSGNCDYNGNGEFDDDVFRWIATSGPLGTVLPETSAPRLVAIDTDVPGGTGGVLGVDGLWVVQVDEAEDGREYDTDATTDRNIVLALDPEAVNPQWNNLHGTVVAVPTTATWMVPATGTTTEFYAAIAEETRTVAGAATLTATWTPMTRCPPSPGWPTARP